MKLGRILQSKRSVEEPHESIHTFSEQYTYYISRRGKGYFVLTDFRHMIDSELQLSTAIEIFELYVSITDRQTQAGSHRNEIHCVDQGCSQKRKFKDSYYLMS